MFWFHVSTPEQHPARAPPEPAEHVSGVAAVATVVTPGEPVVELSELVLPRQVPLLLRLPRHWRRKKKKIEKGFIHKSILAINEVRLS